MRLMILLALLFIPAIGLAQARPTGRVGENHPSLKAIRQLVAAIDSDSAQFAKTKDSATCLDGASELRAHLWIDSTGRPHKYRLSGGSAHSEGEARYYYDSASQLRFIFTRNGAANGSLQEERVYYGPDGSLLYRDARLVEGPRYTGGFDSKPIYTPAEHMAHLCDFK